MRTIGAITTSRADYGIYLPVLRAIEADADLRLRLFVTGMHLSPDFGMTVEQIEKDGFEIAERVACLVPSDSPEAIAKSMGLATAGFSEAYARSRPDMLLALGDRFEMHAAVVAALPFKIPIAHIHGGEVTEGAFDDALRHSITKLSHLHFVSTPEYADRVQQLGEEPWRITVSGAPSLDNLAAVHILSPEALSEKLGVSMQPPRLLVTFHPVTLDYERSQYHIEQILEAIEICGLPVVFTMPNADTGSRIIFRLIEDFAQSRENAQIVNNMGAQNYFSAMNHAVAMVGNSSSGIIEAPSFQLPVVNIGDRQKGRVRAANVIDVDCETAAIVKGIRKAISEKFRKSVSKLDNPYGDGHAARRIVQRLKTVALDNALVKKPFVDLPSAAGSDSAKGCGP